MKIGKSNHLNVEDLRFFNKNGPGSYELKVEELGPKYTISSTKNKDK